MIRIAEWNVGLLLLALIGLTYLYHRMTKWIGRILVTMRIHGQGLRLFLNKTILTVWNVLLAYVVGVSAFELLSPAHLLQGVYWMIPGLVFALIVGCLSYQALVTQKGGEGYLQMFTRSPYWMLLTLLLVVGPAEDIFFIGILQNTLQAQIGWVAILIYMIVFSLYHYGNVLIGTESKKEFLVMLPVRCIISLILAMAFYQTGSLLTTILIHNLFDTTNYLAVVMAKRTISARTNVA